MKRKSVIVGSVAVVAAGLLAACGNVVNGSGATGPGASSGVSSSSGFPTGSLTPTAGVPTGAASSAEFPSATTAPSVVAPTAITPLPGSPSLGGPSAPTTGSDFQCPGIVYPYAHLSFACLTSGMKPDTKDKIWPLVERKVVQRSAGWTLDVGAGHWGSQQSQTLAAIAREVRDDMVSKGSYGTNPTVTALKSVTGTVDGHTAHLVQSEFTINPTWAQNHGVRVKHEVSWIIAIKVAPDDVSLWYASVPDLVSNLWSKIPNEIDSIHVI